MGALSYLNATLIPRISAHPPVLAQSKVHCPWALFCDGTALLFADLAAFYKHILY